MKNGKRPTVKQSKLMQEWRLDPAMWLVVKDTAEFMVVVYRHSDKVTRTIYKEVK